jgi:3-hydroxyisobutyrate dehydrogenase
METVGFVGVGKIGLPICRKPDQERLPGAGYRRSSLAEFEKLGGIAARSAAEIGAAGRDRVLVPASPAGRSTTSCRSDGLAKSARPGQIIVELGLAPGACQGAARGSAWRQGRGLPRRRGERTPAWWPRGKAVIYLAGDQRRARQAERLVGGFADSCLYFGQFGAASRGQASQQPAGRHSKSPATAKPWRSASRPALTSI